MKNINLILFGLTIFACHPFLGECEQCKILTDFSGKISERYPACWKIHVPANHFIQIGILEIPEEGCENVMVAIHVHKTGRLTVICGHSIKQHLRPILVFHDITVRYRNYFNNAVFEMDYEIQNIECLNNNTFRCSKSSCVPETEVCDGVKNCENGADEVGCEIGIAAMEGIKTAREFAISWLKSSRTQSWVWRENTYRSVVALFLSSGANFDGTNLEEEVMAKETERKISKSLLKPSLSYNELSMFLNSLLVIRRNPRSFYGNNLVQLLKKQVEQRQNFTHPVAYLALCNANETWPQKAFNDLNRIFSSESDYPFVRDMQAMAVTALSCEKNFYKQHNVSRNISTAYQNTIRRFKGFQQEDGSFGNVYTTALITQALIASGEENSQDWKLNSTLEYLMNHLNSSSIDFLSTYLILPLLKGKTLSDIANIECSENPRESENDIISERKDISGPKKRIQYSLFIGDDKDTIHTISQMVPVNYTALEVMELAEVENINYEFKRNTISEKVYVYEVANIPNDLEVGKFWLPYLSNAQDQSSFKYLTTSIDELVMKDGDHLIMWYKTVSI